MRLLTLLALAGLSLCTAQYLLIGDEVSGNYHKNSRSLADHDAAVPGDARPDVHGVEWTNARRLAAGLPPAPPRALEGQGFMRRQAPCTSGPPIAFPPHPVHNAPKYLYTAKSDVDDNAKNVVLGFPVSLFGKSTNSIWISTNGVLSFESVTAYQNGQLPQDIPGGSAVFAFWDDLSSSPNYIAIQASATDVSVHWRVTLYNNRDAQPPTNDLNFWLYYTTDTPGIWYTYYNGVSRAATASGGSATIGAQGATNSGLYTQYSFDKPGAVYRDLKIAFDTTCAGRFTVG